MLNFRHRRGAVRPFVNAGVFLCLLGFAPIVGAAQDAQPATDAEGHIVQFERDIAPIFVEHCLECHAGNKAKAGFEIDDRDAVLGYIEPADAAFSMLYADYLIAEDPDMLMPPPSHGGPLSAGELALVRVWIEEGADWPEGVSLQPPAAGAKAEDVAAATDPAPVKSRSSVDRVWAFQGYFHPATVHFPIALLTIGGLFVVLGVVWPKVGTQIPLACLLIGSVTAVVSSAMGWSFAATQGYPGYQAGWGEEVNAHRWSGTIVAALSLLLALIALMGVKKSSKRLNFIWKTGLLALAAMVGLVGHQGGELTYGADFYTKAFSHLKAEPEAGPKVKSEE
ncbi:c-type cytochrome domain-containing protein [Planctomycetaceae bacterium SH139]